ncbi:MULTISPECIES: GMC family oxidoreductase [Catenuloplanes]|uniref:Choline dehydrogenase n=1 Tax=Catenuloplanes niger TaxID=587534 RepID=A0AAE4CSL7_9ACTN|nr:GMC family oxidoreductase N-terminal domain-containing protein [Catenuloplanes niger]MDR7319889.1 choline dehydrogenase [Catenuloplanes niger]
MSSADVNNDELALDARFDVIVCGAGSAGSTVAGRLAAETGLSVLLLEAGGDDERENVRNPSLWPTNLGTEGVWNFLTEPEPQLSGQPAYFPMGRGLGGGGSVNACVWARGHQADWDSYARVAGDDVWDYEHVLDIYRRVESYRGDPDGQDPRRGRSGPMRIQQFPDDHGFFDAVQKAAEGNGIPRGDSLNGALMEQQAGTARRDANIHDGHRQSPYRSFVVPQQGRANLTVLTGAVVDRVIFEGGRAAGVTLLDGRELHAEREVVLSLGAINTPVVLMRSGVGDREHLEQNGILVRRHLPGVGRNLHDHVNVPLVWGVRDGADLPSPLQAVTGILWNLTDPEGPAVVVYVEASISVSPVIAADGGVPEQGVTFLTGVRLHSRGEVRLSAGDASQPPLIRTGWLNDPADIPALLDAVERVSAIADSPELAGYLSERVFPPRDADREAVIDYLRRGTQTFWHQSGTAAMGQGEDAVVDSRLRVRGVSGLRVVDASVLPHVPVANTMAPSVVIGMQGADFIAQDLL